MKKLLIIIFLFALVDGLYSELDWIKGVQVDMSPDIQHGVDFYLPGTLYRLMENNRMIIKRDGVDFYLPETSYRLMGNNIIFIKRFPFISLISPFSYLRLHPELLNPGMMFSLHGSTFSNSNWKKGVQGDTEKSKDPNKARSSGDSMGDFFSFNAKLINIIDGDTIVIMTNQTKITVELYGIDCPELDQPYGLESKAYVSNYCFNKTVNVTTYYRDKYNSIGGKVNVISINGFNGYNYLTPVLITKLYDDLL